MSKRPPPQRLHSLAEACLYVRVTPCRVCAGPLEPDESRFEADLAHRLLALTTTCRTCGATFETQFDAADVAADGWETLREGRIVAPWETPAFALNPGDEASRAIDLAGWLKLFTLIAESAHGLAGAGGTPDGRAQARQMRRVADACLAEALKFFDDDNDLPPDEAFFHDEARRQFWEHPEFFTRQQIADLRFSLMRSQG